MMPFLSFSHVKVRFWCLLLTKSQFKSFSTHVFMGEASDKKKMKAKITIVEIPKLFIFIAGSGSNSFASKEY